MQLNELGALRLQSLTRSLFDQLSAVVKHGSLRPKFARWQQLLSVWSLEKLPDIYMLKLFAPVIPAAELKSILKCRVDFNVHAIDGVAVDRLTCVVH